MAQVLDRYAAIKRRYNAVDFSDLITLAYEVVGDAGVAGRIRERYRVVLLDEYQDTNPAQRELLLAYLRQCVPGNGSRRSGPDNLRVAGRLSLEFCRVSRPLHQPGPYAIRVVDPQHQPPV